MTPTVLMTRSVINSRYLRRKARDSSVIVTELERELASTVIEQQDGSR